MEYNKPIYRNTIYNDGHALIFKLILFIISPFVSFLYSLKNANSKSSYIIYFIFGVIFCWHMEPNPSAHYDDLTGIKERFLTTRVSTHYLQEQINEFFSFSGDGEKEIYEIFLNWLTRQFSDNPHLFFTLASIPFLIFFLKCLKRVTNDPKFNNSITSLIILALFVLPRDIITVQNPRYCTGMWLVVLAIFIYHLDKRKKILACLMVFSAVFFHSGFWATMAIFIACTFISKFHKISVILFYVSIPFSFLAFDAYSVISIESLPIPDNFARWINNYFNDDSVNQLGKSFGTSGYYWINIMFDILKKIAYVGIAVLLLRERKSIDQRKDGCKELFYFFITYFAIVNIIQSIPVLNQRTYFVVRILAIFMWFKLMYPKKNGYLLFVLFTCSWEIFYRYFYKGAVNSSVPYDIFYAPLPVLISDFWGATT